MQAFVTASHIVGERGLAGRYQGRGIHLIGRSQAFIERTIIRQVADGIDVEGMAQVTVHRSTIEHTMFGVHVGEEGQAILTHVEIKNSDDGIVVVDYGQAKVINCRLVDNGIGIALFYYASVMVTDTVIIGSRYYGVLLAKHDPRVWFDGFLVGARNIIPGPGEPDGNRLGAVFPAELAFLMTKEGGTYPKR